MSTWRAERRQHTAHTRLQPPVRTRPPRRACDRMQLAHMLAGLGAMLAPHMQHSTVPGVPAAAYIAFAGLAVTCAMAAAQTARRRTRAGAARSRGTARTGPGGAREE
jgi:hypothetical protein